MTCIAAVGDVHVGLEDHDRVAAGLRQVQEHAQVLLLAGDLTRCGHPHEAEVLADVLRTLDLPMVAVLGNHDHHDERVDELLGVLADAGVEVLEGTAITLRLDGRTLGVAGVKGFGGGFTGGSVSEFGEPLMKEFARCTQATAARLEEALRSVAGADHRIALLHYSPVPDTLRGEHPEVYPFLGSYLLGEAIDRAGADLVLHGHAHMGTERGVTPGGIRVRNVAQPVLGSAYRLFELGGVEAEGDGADRAEVAAGAGESVRSASRMPSVRRSS